VICQSDELFGVKGHGSTPTLKAGRKSQHTRPECPTLQIDELG
jgi:hypothetical protein